jgi:O-antigen/teichoic acid export membrane protein
MLAHLLNRGDFNLKPDLSFLNKNLLKGMFSIGTFGWLNSFSGFAILRIDAIMVNQFINDAATGIYVTTFYFGALVGMPARAIGKIAPTLISDAYKNNDYEIIDVIYRKSALNQFIVAVLIFLGLSINLDNIFHIIPARFEAGRSVIVLIALANVIKMGSGMDLAVISYSKYFKMTTLFLVIFLIILITLNVLLIPPMGIVGAAMASVLATAIFSLMKMSFIYFRFGFQPYNYRFLLIMGISAIIFLLVSLIPQQEHFIADILVRSIIAVVLYALCIYFGRFSIDVNKSVDNVLQKIRQFVN